MIFGSKRFLAVAAVCGMVASPIFAQRGERRLSENVARRGASARELAGPIAVDEQNAPLDSAVLRDSLLTDGAPENLILVPGASLLRDAPRGLASAPLAKRADAAPAGDASALQGVVERMSKPGADASSELDDIYSAADVRAKDPGEVRAVAGPAQVEPSRTSRLLRSARTTAAAYAAMGAGAALAQSADATATLPPEGGAWAPLLVGGFILIVGYGMVGFTVEFVRAFVSDWRDGKLRGNLRYPLAILALFGIPLAALFLILGL